MRVQQTKIYLKMPLEKPNIHLMTDSKMSRHYLAFVSFVYKNSGSRLDSISLYLMGTNN